MFIFTIIFAKRFTQHVGRETCKTFVDILGAFVFRKDGATDKILPSFTKQINKRQFHSPGIPT